MNKKKVCNRCGKITNDINTIYEVSNFHMSCYLKDICENCRKEIIEALEKEVKD